MASELIIQLQNRDGSFNCEKFDNLPAPQSSYVAICFTDNAQSEQLAIELKTKLINSIANLGSNLVSASPACGGNATLFKNCYALKIPENLKLLVVVSDGTNNTFADPSVLTWAHRTLPVLQAGKGVNLPNPFNVPQVAFWKNDIDEVIPTLFGLLGISDSDLRIFISYKRTDTSVFAEQLFDRLHHEGFEVFLDRFSIEPGINFQNRLYQELADKAMVIFLESPDFLKSAWIQLEIDFAKKYRLGLFALNIDDAPKIKSVDDEFRGVIKLDPISKKLDDKLLDGLVTEIKTRHSIALYRMKNYLASNIITALEANGTSTNFDNNGFIDVFDGGGINYKIWTTARPPKINDFHFTDISNLSGEKIIIGPEFMEEKRTILNTWLSTKTKVGFYNEGQILNLTSLIKP